MVISFHLLPHSPLRLLLTKHAVGERRQGEATNAPRMKRTTARPSAPGLSFHFIPFHLTVAPLTSPLAAAGTGHR